jgi:hypothetical protein
MVKSGVKRKENADVSCTFAIMTYIGFSLVRRGKSRQAELRLRPVY